MSGQTYSTTIRVPTPQELAARVAARAREQGVAGARAFDGEDVKQAIAELRAQTLRFIVDTIAPVAAPVSGTTRGCGAAGASVEIAIRGARVPLRVEVDPNTPDTGRLTLAFEHSMGLTCADEARIAAEVAALFARSAVRSPDGGAGAAAPAAREAGR